MLELHEEPDQRLGVWSIQSLSCNFELAMCPAKKGTSANTTCVQQELKFT